MNKALTIVLPPLLSLVAAMVLTALMFAAIGVPSREALGTMAQGAFGSRDGWGYTLFYATDYLFAGLAVAIPYRAGLFNIGGEGQAMIGGLAATLVCLLMAGTSWCLVLPLACIAAGLGGAGWAAVPAWLQVKRGSHIVITTIMFNFLATLLMTWLLVGIMKAPGDPSPETIALDPATMLPELFPGTPFNVTLGIGIVLAIAIWLIIKRSVWGYELRVVGESPEAARYAAISADRVRVMALCLGGACAGLIAVNEIMGSQHRLELGFTAGVGFIGIAVALMGRGHPLGIIAASLFFGALAQGGAELSLDVPNVTRDVVVVTNGLIILFCGALEQLWRRPVAFLQRRIA